MDPVGAWLVLLLLDHVARKKTAPARARRWARRLRPIVVKTERRRAAESRRLRGGR